MIDTAKLTKYMFGFGGDPFCGCGMSNISTGEEISVEDTSVYVKLEDVEKLICQE